MRNLHIAAHTGWCTVTRAQLLLTEGGESAMSRAFTEQTQQGHVSSRAVNHEGSHNSSHTFKTYMAYAENNLKT